MRLPVAVSLIVLLAALPVVAGTPDPAKFAYDLRDARGDVVLVASSGAEVVSAKPEVDILRLVTSLDDGKVSVAVTFAQAPPTQDLRIRVSAGVGDHEWDASEPESNPGVVGTVAGETITLAFDVPPALDPETFQLTEAECMGFTVKAMYVPQDDPVTQSEEGVQGWMDGMHTLPNWCTQGVIPDGLNGPCPAPTLPTGVQVGGSWSDPTGDVMAGFPSQPVDKAASDITSVEASLTDGRVVVRVRTAEAPLDEILDVTLNFEAPELEGFAANHHLKLTYFTSSDHASGSRFEAMFDESPEAFRVDAQPETDGVTLSFCASVVPDDALCAAFDLTLSFREPQRGRDDIQQTPDPCVGKKYAGGAEPTPEPTETPTDEPETTPTPTSTGTTGGSPAGSTTPTPTAGAAASGDSKTPGPGLMLVALALALVAAAARRR